MTAALSQFAKPAASGSSSSKPAPLPAEVDEQAEEFHQLGVDMLKAAELLNTARKVFSARELELIELVRASGGPHAQKSKILHGIVWEMVATFSHYTTQDNAAVERFRLALVKAGKTRLMKNIFSTDVRYTLKASAAEIVKAEKLSPTEMTLLLQCSVTQDKKPSLDVRPKKKPAA